MEKREENTQTRNCPPCLPLPPPTRTFITLVWYSDVCPQVDVDPPLLVVQLGGSAEFRCRVSAAGALVTWFKDGAPVLGGPGGAGGPGGPGGRGAAVLSLGAVSREDRGMYQCVVRRAEGDTAQAAAELRLGGESAAPALAPATGCDLSNSSRRRTPYVPGVL